ncbi:YaaA family protein [Campylobacter sp. 19-13652]|uniref:YaaA family protein n=1 Tax=Campylobacter sp. 19-13652 TaxID=2840180 RepID=UPI001C7464EF|nr:YaaA family protein [Campylobacter sp. 19-13652]BCX79511.1 hypothetical protein LBC_09730 [Campylobacter sp. 19-13652]
MRVLFSPSEAKVFDVSDVALNVDCFSFPSLFEFRKEAINLYNSVINSGNTDEILSMFGTKHIDEDLLCDLGTKGCLKAILRYDGVAYAALKYRLLDEAAKEWIDKNVMIFSNLFGPVLASDLLPYYKLKQGERVRGVALESFYAKHFSKAIDEWLLGEDVLDLRAGFYAKFYKLKQPYITFKFISEGKVVSHYAKHYRGEVLQAMAKNEVKNTDDLMGLKLENLALKEIIKSGLKTEVVLEIVKNS